MRCKFCLSIISGSLLILNCAPIVYSPHAQNEMITPYNRMGEAHEIGGACAFNKWFVNQKGDTLYIRTYPSASFSFFHNAYYGWDKFGGIGGIELIGCPLQWWLSDLSGFILWLKPYAGFQFAGSNTTCRVNFSPLSLSAGFVETEGDVSVDLNRLTFYQLTFLLHNRHPSNHIYWAGIRDSPGAFGIVGGYEYSVSEHHAIRAEYSYLIKPPFPILLTIEELESIKGSVHYLTVGFFKRVK